MDIRYLFSQIITYCAYFFGGVNISKRIQFTLILVLILFLGINAISANEINDNDLTGINSADVIGMDSVDNTNVISSDLIEDQNEENLQTDNLSDGQSNNDDGNTDSADSNLNDGNGDSAGSDSDDITSNTEVSKEKTTISKTSIQRGTVLYIYLKDSNGNPISGKTLSLDIGGNKYTKTTDNNGAVSLKFSSLLGKYTLKVTFNEDSDYLSSNDIKYLSICYKDYSFKPISC